METCYRPQLPKSIPNSLQIQDGNPRINPHITQTRGMSHLNRSIRRILTHPHSPSIKKVPQVPSQRRFIPVQPPTLRTSYSPTGLHLNHKGGKASTLKARHSPTPVPRRLVNQSPFSGRISETYNQTTLTGSNLGLLSKSSEVKTHSPTEVRLHRLPVFTRSGSCQTHK